MKIIYRGAGIAPTKSLVSSRRKNNLVAGIKKAG